MHIIYWISTVLISCFLALSSYTYFFSKSTIEGVRALGFPDFFRIELAVLKLVAIFVILVPSVPNNVKEWGYAGIGLFLITALIAHIAHKDSIFISLLLVVLMALLIISRYTMFAVR
ncbi:DoxX family protein [Flavivirga eckloniae]|uniref:DoxX family protein n=1 Tax=Flavivirga eckloniae TaxID=1803846 RepID=A0A2K9PVX4_9FLAO|nr:DoxX family protein [Flavivirga eckloniae]AUP80978.1 DoxX family protein [Flavivirga eckloniae]